MSSKTLTLKASQTKTTPSKVAVIGDLHGLSIWKSFFVGKEHLYDKIIFIGDYVDSWDIKYILQYVNLVDIIEFKQKYPEKVVLLLGNHDVHYIDADYKCSGFQIYNYIDWNNLYTKHLDLFEFSYVYENNLFTHAGLSQEWLTDLLDNSSDHIKEFYEENTIDTFLNELWNQRHPNLFTVGFSSGGRKLSSPLWLRKSEHKSYKVGNYHQVVGHTYISKITRYSRDEFQGNNLTMIDCLPTSNSILIFD